MEDFQKLTLIPFLFCSISYFVPPAFANFKKLSFGKGTVLSLTPELEIPIIDKASVSVFGTGIGSKFKISLPFTIDLGAMEEHYTNILEAELSSIVNPWWTMMEGSRSDTVALHRKPRAIISNGTSNRHGDRLLILTKLESILESVGIPGRSCLIRAICEVNEFPHWKAYGVFGDFVKTLLKIPEPEDNPLYEHFEAQRNGAKGDCLQYSSNCQKSLFLPM